MRNYFIGIVLFIAGLSIAAQPISRLYNFHNDALNGIPISSTEMDNEFNQVLAAINNTCVQQGSAPSSPVNGTCWWDTTNKLLKFYRNNEWVIYNLVQGGTSYPSTPQRGDVFANWTSFDLGKPDLQAYNGSSWNDFVTTAPTFTNISTGTLISSGNIGIGTSSVPNERLGIFGGNVGIGTSIPGQKLDVNGIVRATSFIGSISNTFVPTNIQVFTTSGTWTKPANVSIVYVKVIGAGGAGGNGSGTNFGGGGGGGGYSEGAIGVTGNVTVTIGATNSFAGTVTIQSTSGSNGGNAGGSAGTAGVGGVGSNGTVNLTGQSGFSGNFSGYGGNSIFGSGGQSSVGTSDASSGSAYGGGGGGGGIGGGSGANGGAGDAGAVIVYY